MKKWGPLVLTFVAGLLIGSSVAWRGVEHRRMENRQPEIRNQRMVKLFAKKLDLAPEQRKKLAQILADKREKMDALHGDVRPRFEEMRKTTQDEIRAILTPDQVEKFNELEKKRDERRRKRNGNGPQKP